MKLCLPVFFCLNELMKTSYNMLYKTTISFIYMARTNLHFLYIKMVMKGVIKHSITWIQMIGPIIIIGRQDTFPEHLVESVLALAIIF